MLKAGDLILPNPDGYLKSVWVYQQTEPALGEMDEWPKDELGLVLDSMHTGRSLWYNILTTSGISGWILANWAKKA